MVDVADKFHIPVMAAEVIKYLNLKPGATIVDGTIGTGGHSRLILERILPGGRLIAIDRDEESLDICRGRLSRYKDSIDFVHANFIGLDAALSSLGVGDVDGIILDLGISSFQLGRPDRGFSFQAEGPLDMRLDRTSYISAYDLINNLNEDEISTLLWNFGQERWHSRIARIIVEERLKNPITTTEQLAKIVMRSIPRRYRHAHYRIHPATRTFQAVRIAVNRELETLERAIDKAIGALAPQGRLCIISFHSLEDRIVKHSFRAEAGGTRIRILTNKPLTPLPSEINSNPSSRSSKLRVAEKL